MSSPSLKNLFPQKIGSDTTTVCPSSNESPKVVSRSQFFLSPSKGKGFLRSNTVNLNSDFTTADPASNYLE